jgi:hypothetical protein
LLHARVGMLKAMNHGQERMLSDHKAMHWGSGSSNGTSEANLRRERFGIKRGHHSR